MATRLRLKPKTAGANIIAWFLPVSGLKQSYIRPPTFPSEIKGSGGPSDMSPGHSVCVATHPHTKWQFLATTSFACDDKKNAPRPFAQVAQVYASQIKDRVLHFGQEHPESKAGKGARVSHDFRMGFSWVSHVCFPWVSNFRAGVP